MNLKHSIMDHDEELKQRVHIYATLFAFVIGLVSGWTFPIGTIFGPVVLVLLMNGLTTELVTPIKTQLVWLASAVVGQSGTIYLVSGSWKIMLWANLIFLVASAFAWVYERWNWSRAQ